MLATRRLDTVATTAFGVTELVLVRQRRLVLRHMVEIHGRREKSKRINKLVACHSRHLTLGQTHEEPQPEHGGRFPALRHIVSLYLSRLLYSSTALNGVYVEDHGPPKLAMDIL